MSGLESGGDICIIVIIKDFLFFFMCDSRVLHCRNDKFLSKLFFSPSYRILSFWMLGFAMLKSKLLWLQAFEVLFILLFLGDGKWKIVVASRALNRVRFDLHHVLD
jgi:hypothetical protein